MPLVDKPKNINKRIFENGNTIDIVKLVYTVFQKNWEQCRLLADDLEGRNRTETCKNIFDFIDENISYKTDIPGEQNIRTPARLINDKFGDCKSYTILIASILRCLKIPFFFRFVAYSPGDVTHVYIVAQTENNEPIYIDVVAKKQRNKPFNTEINYLSKIDIDMNTGTKINYLSGVGETPEREMFSIDFGKNLSLKLNEIQLYCLKNLLLQKARKIKDTAQRENLLNQISVYDICLSLIEKFGTNKDNLELSGYYLANEIKKGVFQKIFTKNPSENTSVILSDIEKRNEYYTNLFTSIENNIQVLIDSGKSQNRQYVIDSGFLEETKEFNDFWQTEILAKNYYISKSGVPSNFPFNNKANILKVADLLMDSAPYFAYTQLPSTLTTGKEFKRKKEAQEKLLQWILDSNTGLNKECIINIIQAGIINKTGVLPGNDLINKFKREKPGINSAKMGVVDLHESSTSDTSVWGGITSSINSLTDLVTSIGTVFNPTSSAPTNTQLANYTPSYSDWSSANTMNIVIGAVLIGGVIYFLKRKKSKKAK